MKAAQILKGTYNLIKDLYCSQQHLLSESQCDLVRQKYYLYTALGGRCHFGSTDLLHPEFLDLSWPLNSIKAIYIVLLSLEP